MYAVMQVMSTRTERRAKNKTGTFSIVKTGFQRIFTDRTLANIVLRAVDLTTLLLIQRDLLANLHALRLCEEDADIPSFDLQFFNQCSYAESHATGFKCRQFKSSTNSSLATTLQLYEQHRPLTTGKPERPTFTRHVRSHV